MHVQKDAKLAEHVRNDTEGTDMTWLTLLQLHIFTLPDHSLFYFVAHRPRPKKGPSYMYEQIRSRAARVRR